MERYTSEVLRLYAFAGLNGSKAVSFNESVFAFYNGLGDFVSRLVIHFVCYCKRGSVSGESEIPAPVL